MSDYLSLIVLVFSPLVAFALIISPLLGDNEVFIRRFAKGFASLHFLYTLLFLAVFEPNAYSMSFETELKLFDISWLKTLGINATFGVDALSLLLVVLTSFTFLIALVASKSAIRTKHKFYYSTIFLLECAVLGVFCAKDMFLFFLFWELELIPMYFLISEWGSGDAKKSAMKFVLYTFFGSIFMLLGMLALYFYSFASNGVLTANIDSLSISGGVYPFVFQIAVFLAFLIGFAVKLPIVPFHTWLPEAHSDAVTPVSMILAAILLKMGAYGLIRFNLLVFPEVFRVLAPIIMIFAVINIVYAASIAFVQKDLKRIVAYSSISHMGIVLLGLASLNKTGLNGAIFQIFAHAFISAGLFMLVGLIYLKCKTRNIDQLRGLGVVMPKLMSLSVPICFAAAGLPLLAGFPGELMSFIGSLSADYDDFLLPKICSLIAIFALILSAAYILKTFHSAFYGSLPSQWTSVKDIVVHQSTVLYIICGVIIIFGVFPWALLNIYSPFTTVIMDILKV